MFEFSQYGALALADVEDIAQSVLIELLRAPQLLRQVLENGGSPSAYVAGMARHKILDLRRRRHREQEALHQIGDDVRYSLRSKLASIGSIEDEEFLHECLQRLTPAERLILRKKIVEEKSMKEIGAQLGLNPSTVATRLFRILNRLRTWLAETEDA